MLRTHRSVRLGDCETGGLRERFATCVVASRHPVTVVTAVRLNA